MTDKYDEAKFKEVTSGGKRTTRRRKQKSKGTTRKR
jgi:hypothetical protein